MRSGCNSGADIACGEEGFRGADRYCRGRLGTARMTSMNLSSIQSCLMQFASRQSKEALLEFVF
jgi:hypothetical protein